MMVIEYWKRKTELVRGVRWEGWGEHTVETRAILELVFHEFDEKELLRAEFLWRP